MSSETASLLAVSTDDQYWLAIVALAPDCQIVQSSRESMLRQCHKGFHRILYISEIQSWGIGNSLPIDPSKWTANHISQFNVRFLNDY